MSPLINKKPKLKMSKLLCNGYKKALSAANIDPGTSRTSQSITSKFSKFSILSSGLTSRESAHLGLNNQLKSSNFSQDKTKSKSKGEKKKYAYNFNVGSENSQIIKNFKKKKRGNELTNANKDSYKS